MEKEDKVLIFNVNWLGDCLFSTATIRNIRRNFPNSFIACIIPSRCYPILKENPNLDEFIIFDEKNRHRSFLAKLNFIKLLKHKKFDIVFLLHRSFTRALICWLAGIPKRIGYSTAKRAFLLTTKVSPPKKDSLHRIDYYLNMIKNAGFEVKDKHPEFFISEEDNKFVDDFLIKNSIKSDDFLIVVSPAGNWDPKRWPKEYWVQLIDRLIREFAAKVIITAAGQDLPLILEIKQMMKEEPIIACGNLNLKHLGALCRRADLFISADTGPLHIANAVGTKKIIALFGPTSPAITGPYPQGNVIILKKNVGCLIPCYVVNCSNNRCMKAITVEDVIEKIRLLKVTKNK